MADIMAAMSRFIAANHLGDWASIVGVLVAVVGFLFTLIGLHKAKSASTLAAEEVHEVRRDIARLKSVAELSTAIAAMDELKRLHRDKALSLLPDRYSAIRRLLITIRRRNNVLSDEHMTSLQSAIVNLKIMEDKTETLIGGPSHLDTKTMARFNKTISTQIDELVIILPDVQNSTGNSEGG